MTSTSPGTPSIKSPDVIWPTDFWILTPDGRRIKTAGTMLYTKSDAWAVTIDFVMPNSEIVPWTFARQLLSDGRYGWQGLMNVQIGPHHHNGAHIAIVLTSGEGRAYVIVRRSEVSQFMARTQAVVPYGSEVAHLDIDALIGALTGRVKAEPMALPKQSDPAAGPDQPPARIGFLPRRRNQGGRHRAEP